MRCDGRASWRNHSMKGVSGRDGLSIPESLVIGRESVVLEEAPRRLVEAPDIERQKRDAELLRSGPPGADERIADTLAAMIGADADVVQIDHLLRQAKGPVRPPDHLGIGIADRLRIDLGKEEERLRRPDQLGDLRRRKGISGRGLE